MNFANRTRKHHFVSQCEQRLNAIDRNLAKDMQEIYAFDVTRDAEDIRLDGPRRVRIQKNLVFPDLFSFSAPDGTSVRENFESLFQRYENRMSIVSTKVVDAVKSGKVSRDLMKELFGCKMINFIRSPYSVQKAMNTFGAATAFRPTVPEINAVRQRLVGSEKRHRKEICERFRIDEQTYDHWLLMIFSILQPMGNRNFLDQMVDALFDNQSVVGVSLHTYSDGIDKEICLLSDRGFNTIVEEEGKTGIEFNVCAKSFVSYWFLTPHAMMAEIAPAWSEEQRELVLRQHNVAGEIRVFHDVGNVRHLTAYNMRTATQCARQVFAAREVPAMR